MGTINRDMSGAWRARYRDPSGKQRSRNFPRRRDAEQFLTSGFAACHSGPGISLARLRSCLGLWCPLSLPLTGIRVRRGAAAP